MRNFFSSHLTTSVLGVAVLFPRIIVDSQINFLGVSGKSMPNILGQCF